MSNLRFRGKKPTASHSFRVADSPSRVLCAKRPQLRRVAAENYPGCYRGTRFGSASRSSAQSAEGLAALSIIIAATCPRMGSSFNPNCSGTAVNSGGFGASFGVFSNSPPYCVSSCAHTRLKLYFPVSPVLFTVGRSSVARCNIAKKSSMVAPFAGTSTLPGYTTHVAPFSASSSQYPKRVHAWLDLFRFMACWLQVGVKRLC